MKALDSARSLAAAAPAAMLPCPVCGVGVKGQNLERHLEKHPATPDVREARGVDRKARRIIILLPFLWPLFLFMSRWRATLAWDDRALTLRYGFGLLKTIVALPAALEVGSLKEMRAGFAHSPDVHVPGTEHSAGSYLRLFTNGRSLTVGVGKGDDGGVRKHWSATRGPSRKSWDVTLAPAAFVALQYHLLALGLLAPKAN